MIWRRLLVPFFLAPLDRYLRNNRPLIWRTRAHVILFYSLLPVNVLCYLLGRFREVNTAHIPTSQNLLFYTIGLLAAGLLFFLLWSGDQRRLPLQKQGWRIYWLTSGLYLLCLLSLGLNVLVYITPVIQKTATLLPPEETDRAYDIARRWDECSRCECSVEVHNRASAADREFMLQLATQMGYDTLKELACDYADSNRVYLVVEDGYLIRSKNFHRRIESLREAQAFVRGQGVYFRWYYRLFPLGLLLFGWLGAQWLYLASVRGSRPRRERAELFARRDLLDLWVIGRLDRFLLRQYPWWWNVQLHRWLFYVLFWGNAALLLLAYGLPLRLGSLADDLSLFAVVLLCWILGGVGWFIGWVYQRSLQGAVRKDPWRNLLLVLGYLLAFYALLFNVGVFCTALAFRLDRLLPDEQLLDDLRYRLDNENVAYRGEYNLAYGYALSDDAHLWEWRAGDGFEEYYAVKGTYAWAWAQRIYQLKRTAETVFAATENISVDSVNGMLLNYAERLVAPARLPAIPEVVPRDTIIGDSLRRLNELMSANMTVPEHLIDSVLEVRSRPVEDELGQLYKISRGSAQALSLGQACLDWRLAALTERREALRAEFQQTYDILTSLDQELIKARRLPAQEKLSPSDSIQLERFIDTLSSVRSWFLSDWKLPELPPGAGLDEILSFSAEYKTLTALLQPLEAAQNAGGYLALARRERERLIRDRIDYLQNELETMRYNRYRIEQELREERTATIEGQIKWLEGLREPPDYFNHSLFLFIDRLQEDALAQRQTPADVLAELERQAAELTRLNTRHLDEVLFEMPFDPCRELENMKSRDTHPVIPDLDRQETLDAFDLACRYRLQKDSRLARFIDWVADRLFDFDLSFQYASKLAPAWAIVLEAKNFRYGQGIVYNLLTLYMPLYALPFVLTYIFIAFAFYYFPPATVGMTAIGTLFFFTFLSFLPNRFFLEDPTWAYLATGGFITMYGFFYRNNYSFLNYLALGWFFCSPLLLFTLLTDKWWYHLAEKVTVDKYSLATEPAGLLWLVWLGFLLTNLAIVLIGARVFARQAYLPD